MPFCSLKKTSTTYFLADHICSTHHHTSVNPQESVINQITTPLPPNTTPYLTLLDSFKIEAYINTLRPALFPPPSTNRDFIPLFRSSNQVQALRDLLTICLEYLTWAVPGVEGDGMREEVGKLHEMVKGWLFGMVEMGGRCGVCV